MKPMKSRLSWHILEKLPYKATATEYRFNCIFCPEPDREFHLYVNRHKGIYHCFRCGAKGRLRELADVLTLDNFSDVIKQRSKLVTYTEDKIVKSLPRSRPIAFCNTSNIHHRHKIDIARKYLIMRGLRNYEINNNKVRVCIDDSGIYENSVIFPIGKKDNPDYFVCRKLAGEPKYVNAPWNKGSLVYRPASKHMNTPYLVICEGVFDAIRIARVADVRGLLGKEASREQIEYLTGLEKPLLVCLDQDAETYTMKLTANLASYYGTIAAPVFLKGKYKDPGDAPSNYLNREFERAYLQLTSRSSGGDSKRPSRNGTHSNY